MYATSNNQDEPLLPILVVDDDVDQAEILTRTFRAWGMKHPINRITLGGDCLKTLDRANYGAVILDYSLPDLTGLEVLKQIGDSGHDVPVIIVTGQGDESIAVHAMKEGAYDYVVKTGDYFKRLPSLVTQVIEKHELRMRLREFERATLQRNRELAALNEISTAVNASLDLNIVCEHALEKMLEVTHLDIGGIYLCQSGQRDLMLKAFRNSTESHLDPLEFVSSETGAIAECFKQGSALVTNGFEFCVDESDFTTSVCLPLISKNERLGVIVASSRQERSFAADELQLLSSIANQISTAIENANLFEQTRSQAEEIAAKNRELIEAQEKLIEAERRAAVGQIGITVRHEINNPLTAILGQTQLLLMRRDPMSDDIKNRLKTIEHLSLRIRDIVKKLEAIKQAPVTEYVKGEYMIDLDKAG